MKSLTSLIRARLQYFHNINNKCLYCTSERSVKNIKIPDRIHRSPTDILQALASTISRDPTAAHFKYHDDPYLIPMSNMGKRTFALAQEAGRKTAHWIRQEHSNLFQHSVADPPIKAFMPTINFTEESDVTEDDLKSVIKDVFVSDAIFIYKLLKAKNVEIDVSTKQSLLELLCFYNGEDTLPEELIEERWFKQGAKGKERPRKLWRDGSFAEELFSGMENPNSEAYCAIIQGLSKYNHADRVWQLFKQSEQENVPLNTNTYNAILKMAPFLKESHEMRWTLMQDILNLMSRQDHALPNLGTMNAILEVLSGMASNRNCKKLMLATLSEFKTLGIEPSLATWYHFLVAFCRDRGTLNPILHDIMDVIQNKEFEIRDAKDTHFFVTAMEICRNYLNDKDLAHRVHRLLDTGNNYDLIGDSFKESIYYRHYFALLCTSEPLNSFMENYYNKLVPNIYIPEPGVMAEVLKAVEVEAAISYIPKLWSDMVTFDLGDKEVLVTTILEIMVNNEPSPESNLIERFTAIGLDIWERIGGQHEEKRNKLSFTGSILGNIMILCLRGEQFDKACMIMDKLDREQHTVVGIPQIDALSLFVDHCIENKSPSRAINCIQYCADAGFNEAAIFANRLNDSLTLDENQLQKLTNIVGSRALQRRTNDAI